MPGKRVQLDDATWSAIDLLARDSMKDFQELANEAFADLLKKHGRPTDLKTALRQSVTEISLAGAATLLLADVAADESFAADLSPLYKSAPQAKEQGVDGFIDLYAGWQWWNWGGDEASRGNQGGLGAAARVNWWINSPWAIQLEGTSNNSDFTQFDCKKLSLINGAHWPAVDYSRSPLDS
jgi:hypothetical protein